MVPNTLPARSFTRCVGLAVLLMLGLSARADDESQHNLLLFTSVDSLDTFDESIEDVRDSRIRPVLDVLYSYSGDDFRFLAEYLWTSDEAELERMKAGWEFSDNGILWLGRFHTTAKYWTSEFHHGQYMQTSITRPSVEEWEDESGPIPSHVTGLMVQWDDQKEEGAAFEYAFSAGLAPKFVGQELVAFDMLDPRSDHGGSINARIAYTPNVFKQMRIGLLAGWNDINVDSDTAPALADLNNITQLTVGAFGDWQWDSWRVLAYYVFFDNDLEFVDRNEGDDFVLGYVQFEYEFDEEWTFFGRADNSFGEDNSPYLRLLPAFLSHRHMLGLRWDFAELHALTLEVAETSRQGSNFEHDSFKEIRFQWSAVFR